MAYDHDEQEQLETLKAFWKTYGGFITTALLIIALSVVGWRGWQWHQDRQSMLAGQLYEELRQAAAGRDVAKTRDAAGRIFADYPGTSWAQMSALLAADVYLDAGDANAAKVPLQWAAGKAIDPAFRMEARFRLAGILLDEKAHDDALGQLAGVTDKRYAALAADRRGDILSAQGKAAEARIAYREALKGFDASNPLRRLVQIKLDALGEEPA
jgi:predicted negative regulator of RcsB-dependent stress response